MQEIEVTNPLMIICQNRCKTLHHCLTNIKEYMCLVAFPTEDIRIKEENEDGYLVSRT